MGLLLTQRAGFIFIMLGFYCVLSRFISSSSWSKRNVCFCTLNHEKFISSCTSTFFFHEPKHFEHFLPFFIRFCIFFEFVLTNYTKSFVYKDWSWKLDFVPKKKGLRTDLCLILCSYFLGLWFLFFSFVFLNLGLCSYCACSRYA